LSKNSSKSNRIGLGEHSTLGRTASLTGLVLNCLLALVKLIIGLASGSVAVTADGVNNLSDTASSALTLIGFRLARRPADDDHPYGHARYEYLAALAVSVLVLTVGAELMISSVKSIMSPVPPELSLPMLGALLLSAAVKLWMWGYFAARGRQIGSDALLAAGIDSRNDAVSSAAVLLGCGVNYLFELNIDGWLGLAVALFIFVSGLRLAGKTVSPILGKQGDRELTDKISRLILSREKVLGMHDLLVHDYGPGQCYATAHVEMSAEENMLDCHELIDSIESEALEKMNVHLLLHCDPVLRNDAERNRLLSLTESAARDIDPRFSVHDFRMVRKAGQIKLVFDLTVDYASLRRCSEIKERLDSALQSRGVEHKTLVHFDGKTL